MRVILVLHRYLAVSVGLLMTLWCLSGFVMMYQAMPGLSGEERLQGLEPLDLAGCCNLTLFGEDDAAPAQGFRIEMLQGTPVLRGGAGFGRRAEGGGGPVDLRTGQSVEALSDGQIMEIAARFGQGNGIAGQPRALGIVDLDQWTIQSARRNRPTHHFAFDDPAGTEIYVNGSTGEVFQDTNRRERYLAWIGVIPHWLYPTVLRQNGPVWTQIVIWTSIIGTFLAATGLYVGISRFQRRKKDGKWSSPFRGWWYWHHITGLVFGILALTWVFSGLMTMNPWGALDGRGAGGELRSQIAGSATVGDVKRFLSVAEPVLAAGQFVQLQASTFNNKLYVIASRADGTQERLDANGDVAVIGNSEVEAVIARLPVKSSELMETEDSYYYGHKNEAALPVFRVILDDAEETRLYINPESGAFRSVDSSGRWSRWIRRGLHGLDFSWLRVRPIWDIVVILLLAGVTAVCATGTWMAFKRVKFDWQRIEARINRRDYSAVPENSP